MANSAGSLTLSSILSIPNPTTTRGQATNLGASRDGTTRISYGSGRTAVVRDLDDPTKSQLFTGHAANVTVCKILSPYYAASGDAAGNLKVWDTTGSYSLKLEAKPIARITDLASDGEGKRLVVVGEGRQSYGATFSLDTGSSIGEVSGHSKVVNCVAMRRDRPFRAVTGSDDFSTVVLNGVPFKYASTTRRHTRFVQSVDYSPTGALFVSSGSDGQVLLYDGNTGEERGAFVDGDGGAHGTSGVFAASFDKKQGAQIASSAADGRVKLWDVETRKVVQTWEFKGDGLQSQQVGNVWAGDSIVSLSFSGDLNVLDPRSAEPSRIVYGHQNPVTALASAAAGPTFFSGDSSGRVLQTSAQGVSTPVSGQAHAGLVVDIAALAEGSSYMTAGYDDTVKQLSGSSGFDSSAIATGSQPKGLASAPAASSQRVFLATSNDISILSNGSKTATVPLPNSAPTCIASDAQGTLVAVGTEDLKVALFACDSNGSSLTKLTEIELRAAPSALAFTPQGENLHLAVGLASGKTPLYEIIQGTTGAGSAYANVEIKLVHARWADTTAKVNALKWNDDGTKLASASLDESVRVYDRTKPSNVVAAKNVHRGGVSSIVWVGNDTLVSAGADGVVKRHVLKG